MAKSALVNSGWFDDLLNSWYFYHRNRFVFSLSLECGLALADESVNESEVLNVSYQIVMVSIKHFKNITSLIILDVHL